MVSKSKIIAFLFLFLPCLLTTNSATTLDSFLQTLADHTLRSDFVISVCEEASQPMNYPGTITMRGDRFTLEMFDMEAAFDGKTLYVYSATTDELTLSTPTEQELMEANPFRYAQALSKVCTITEQTAAPQALTITLTPNDQSAGIQRFTLRIEKETMLPSSIEIKEGKQLTTLRLTNPTYTAAIPSFILTKPDAFLNDLR